MEEFIEAIFYKNNNAYDAYYTKLMESANKNYSLAFYELATITSDKIKAQQYFHLCVILISDDDMEVAKRLQMELDDLDYTLFNESVDDIILNISDMKL